MVFRCFATKSLSFFRVCWVLGKTRTISGSTKHPAHPEDEDGVSGRNVGKLSHVDAVVCPRKFHLEEETCVEKQFGKYQQPTYMTHRSARVK